MTQRTLPLRAIALVVLLALATWAGVRFAKEGQSPSPRLTTVFLAHLLGDARIESPLLSLPPANDLDELSDPDVEPVLDENFEDFDWQFARWSRTPGAEIVREEENHVLRLEDLGGGSLGWALPVYPEVFYRFERSVRSEGEPFCDVYVVESSEEFDEETLPQAQQHRLAGRGAALRVHRIPIDSGRDVNEAGWQRGGTSFFPTDRTRSLAVVFRQRAADGNGTSVREMWFDDIRLDALHPSREDRIRLLKGAHLAPTADPELGMRKAGLLLPLPSATDPEEGQLAESNYNWRTALYAPPTTAVSFDLAIPAGARLRLATGLASESSPGSRARFQVELAEEGAEPERLCDVVKTAVAADWHWDEIDLDLSSWAGREGTLVLRTVSEKGDPHPLWGSPRLESAGTQSDPLVILIAVDTLRADRLSSYGYERETTPALDRLAADGVRFDQARSNCNWTCPSFASIFTGLVPARHGVTSYGPATPLPEELVTLAEHLQVRGWATRSIAYKVPLFDGNYEQGFDESFNVPRDVIRGEENLARALEWVDQLGGGPSFLFLHFNDPHQPFVHPEPLDRTFGFAADLHQGVANTDTPENRVRFAELYDGAVAYVDSCIGRFLDELRERGLYDAASIVFVADHGEQLWEHGRFGHGGRDLYDEVVRVPLIVKPPRGSFQPAVVTAEVSGFDVMPTLLELAGCEVPDGLDARSLLPLIAGAKSELGRPVVTESLDQDIALVHEGYKYILQTSSGREALFDLGSDPGELTDLVTRQPEETRRLRSLAIAYFLEHRPGNYLLARTGDEDAHLRVSTSTVRGLVGPRPERDSSSSSSVQLAANSWTLLEVEGGNGAGVLVEGLETRGADSGFESWIPGTLPTLEGSGVWRVQGPLPTAVLDTSADTLDAELLERLKALGYAE